MAMNNCKKLCLQIFPTKTFERHFSVSSVLAGKRNFRKFPVYNKRGTRIVKEAQRTAKEDALKIYKRGVRDTVIMLDGIPTEIPEKIPELIVPDLTDCKLKPYVSYKTPEIVQSEYTSLDLFNTIYAEKIINDFKEKKLDANGNSLEPNEYELMTPQEAFIKARKTGSDIF